MATATSIAELRQPVGNMPMAVSNAINQIQEFELLQRRAKLFATATMLPDRFKGNMGNCAIAIQLSDSMDIPLLTVMQALYIVHGTPAWSAQFLIGRVNTCGRYETLRYEWKGEPGKDDWGCRAWTVEKSTGEKLMGSWVDWKMVKAEGWEGKQGSKWKTMAEQMFRYRAGAFWQRAYAPEISQNMRTAEEEEDAHQARMMRGHYSVTLEDLEKPQLASLSAPAETINPETGEITTQAADEPPSLSLETLTKRVKAAASLDALTEIMNLPDCESLNAAEVKQLSAAYESRCKELEV